MKKGPIDLTTRRAQSLLKLAERDPIEAERRFNALPFFEKMAMVLSVRGRDRERLILLSKEPHRLVERMPEEEFYFTVKEIGEGDSLTLLELASPRQIAFCLDLEVWKKNRLRPQDMLRWIELLMDCGEDKAVEAVRALDQELLVTFLQRYLKVYKPDSPIEEVELDRDDLITLDRHYYIHIRFRQAEEILERFLDMLFRRDQALYRDLLEGVLWEVPGEIEELARRWRQGRLADRGFPEWEDAMEIYRFVRPELVSIDKGIKETYGPDDEMKRWGEVGSNFYLLPLPNESFLKEVLEEASRQGLDWLKGELVYLCNRAMVADSVDPSNLDAVRELLSSVYDYLNLGLSYLARGDPREGLRAVRKLYLKEIFQVGFSLTLRLRHRLERIIAKSPWLSGNKRNLSLLDPPLREFVGGLLGKKPLLYEGVFDPSGLRYRTFRTLEEIALAEDLIGYVEAISELHHRLYGWEPEEVRGIDLKGCHPSSFQDLTFKALTLTALAQRERKGEFRFLPLPLSELKPFLQGAFPIKGNRTGEELRKEFIDRVWEFVKGLSDREPKMAEYIRRFFREALEDLRNEYGDVDLSAPLDPRFLRLLVLKEA
ncbi:MAG: hypothetical protein DRG31_01025 [Deltaproteobacteria bacterium]|nr:MAG: hypothetical protein DRG31_01025 [Deltaproteobacteria bacterium]